MAVYFLQARIPRNTSHQGGEAKGGKGRGAWASSLQASAGLLGVGGGGGGGVGGSRGWGGGVGGGGGGGPSQEMPVCRSPYGGALTCRALK